MKEDSSKVNSSVTKKLQNKTPQLKSLGGSEEMPAQDLDEAMM